ncbi:MAG: DNA-binding protein [Gemmataceae bacterium]
MTTTISIALGEEQFDRLRAMAQQAGVSPEEMASQELDKALARREEAFLRAAREVLRENAELYRRLA